MNFSIFSDLHTHTCFCDGKNTPKEMVQSAVSRGLTTYGISGHSHTVLIPKGCIWSMTLDGQLEYAKQINELKKEYAGQIRLLLGAEVDYFAEPLNFTPDYVIGGVHAVNVGDCYFEVDDTAEIVREAIDEFFGGDDLKFVKVYYSLVADVVAKTNCDIIAHFDLITKFSEKNPLFDTSSDKYKSIALEALDALIEKDRIFEINTGAIARGWRTYAYPDSFILKRLAEKGARVMLNSDSHSAGNIGFCFKEATEYAKACGIKEFACI